MLRAKCAENDKELRTLREDTLNAKVCAAVVGRVVVCEEQWYSC